MIYCCVQTTQNTGLLTTDSYGSGIQTELPDGDGLLLFDNVWGFIWKDEGRELESSKNVFPTHVAVQASLVEAIGQNTYGVLFLGPGLPHGMGAGFQE